MPSHPVADWKHEVINDDTRLGYWEWVVARLEAQTGENYGFRSPA